MRASFRLVVLCRTCSRVRRYGEVAWTVVSLPLRGVLCLATSF